jgi:hypothetical protein
MSSKEEPIGLSESTKSTRVPPKYSQDRPPGEKYQQAAPSPRKRRKSATERSPDVEEIQVITFNTIITVTF